MSHGEHLAADPALFAQLIWPGDDVLDSLRPSDPDLQVPARKTQEVAGGVLEALDRQLSVVNWTADRAIGHLLVEQRTRPDHAARAITAGRLEQLVGGCWGGRRVLGMARAGALYLDSAHTLVHPPADLVVRDSVSTLMRQRGKPKPAAIEELAAVGAGPALLGLLDSLIDDLATLVPEGRAGVVSTYWPGLSQVRR